MAAELRPLTISTEADAMLQLRELGCTMTASRCDSLRLPCGTYKARHLDAAESAILQTGVEALGGDVLFSGNRADAIFSLAVEQLPNLAQRVATQPELTAGIMTLYQDRATGPRWSDNRGNSLLADRGTSIMGVLNVTPDSFSDGGQYLDPGLAEEHALRMVAQGAHIIDIGGLSTRPGSQPVSIEEEVARTQPIIQRLAGRVNAPLSIDTYRSQVAQRALDAGATIVNDVSGLHFDEKMAAVCARNQAAVVLMHTSAKPEVMMQHTDYQDLIHDVRHALQQSMEQALEAGIPAERIALDPGFGFGKTADQGWELLRRISEFRGSGRPILIGLSRKSFFRTVLGDDRPPEERDVASGMAAASAVLTGGADIVRTHHVPITRDCLAVADRLTMPPGR